MKKGNILIFALVVVIATLSLTIYLQKKTTPEPTVEETVKTLPQKPVKQAIVHYPVPTPTIEKETEKPLEIIPQPGLPKTLPPVEQSDVSIQEALKNLNIKAPLYKLILPENFIQRLVTTIDNLPEKRMPRAHLPFVPPNGRFITSGTADSPQTSSRNQERYNAYVQFLQSINQDQALKVYVHFYPLFQEAYEQLGYRNAYFNDRLINIIDHLLETPNPAEPILLAQPSVLYTYADPLLEKLSAGQKILLRIGPNHRRIVKETLQGYRDKLIDLTP